MGGGGSELACGTVAAQYPHAPGWAPRVHGLVGAVCHAGLAGARGNGEEAQARERNRGNLTGNAQRLHVSRNE